MSSPVLLIKHALFTVPIKGTEAKIGFCQSEAVQGYIASENREKG